MRLKMAGRPAARRHPAAYGDRPVQLDPRVTGRGLQDDRPHLPRPFHFAAVHRAPSRTRRHRRLPARRCALQANTTATSSRSRTSACDSRPFTGTSNDRVIGTLRRSCIARGPVRRRLRPTPLAGPTRLIEPPWKAVLSNKGILPMLWRKLTGPSERSHCQPSSTAATANFAPRLDLQAAALTRRAPTSTCASPGGTRLKSDDPYR